MHSLFSLSRPVLLSGVLLAAACAPLPPGPVGTELPARWQASPNFDVRRPNYVILHQTTNATVERALQTLTDPLRQVSSHYLIARDGAVLQLVDERARAWHAGESWWGGLTDLNSASIGIELDNTGDEPFAEAQVVALLDLLADLQARYRIPAANFLGHGDIAPGRKVDPSRYFPWQRLAAQGFGHWCDAPAAAPPGFDELLALQALGYKLENPDAVRRAFRRHWGAGRDEPAADLPFELDAGEKAMLACLVAIKSGG